MRLGTSTESHSDENPVIIDHMYDSGFQESETCSFTGRVLTLRRNLPALEDATDLKPFQMNTIRAYESPNLLEKYAATLQITKDTSSESDRFYKKKNLITNLRSRTPCSQYKAKSPVRGPLIDATGENYANYYSCFAATEKQLAANGHKFVLGVDFGEPVFLHAIFVQDDLRGGKSWENW